MSKKLPHQLTSKEKRMKTVRVVSPKEHPGYNMSYHPTLNRLGRRYLAAQDRSMVVLSREVRLARAEKKPAKTEKPNPFINFIKKLSGIASA